MNYGCKLVVVGNGPENADITNNAVIETVVGVHW